MEQHLGLKEQIERLLGRNLFAVLATQHAGQPHASLMAFTPVGGVRYLVFATYRSTLKYRNLLEDGRVAVLIEERGGGETHPGQRLVLTALGDAAEVPKEERQAALSAHLARHPDLGDFLDSPDCALVRVAVRAYEVVGGIDDVKWYHTEEGPCPEG